MPLRRRNDSLSKLDTDCSPTPVPPAFMYPNVSTYRSLFMDLYVYSPSVMDAAEAGQKSLPVFSDNDQVGGKVILDPKTCSSGRLCISIEGAFKYNAPEDCEDAFSETSLKRHVFFSANTIIPVSPTSESGAFTLPPRSSSRYGLKEAFSSVRRWPSYASLNTAASASAASPPTSPATPNRGDRSYPFTFDLPRGTRSREEIPPSFASTSREGSHSYSVEYKILVSWEPADTTSDSASLEVPFLLLPEADFQSRDGVATEPESWLEMPLRADRPMPFKCAVTLPTSVTFSRSSSVPYFVVFTTIPRCSTLSREIAADATISVSIQRQVSVMEQTTLPPSPPQTPSSSSEEGGADFSKVKLFKRVVSRSPRIPFESSIDLREKPLPCLPTHTVFSDTSTVQTSMCIGFPKRPRQQCEGQNHPSLETQSSLPDGLLKSKIMLNRQMIPSIDWAGLSVKYYFDVSVLMGQEELRARVPIRII